MQMTGALIAALLSPAAKQKELSPIDEVVKKIVNNSEFIRLTTGGIDILTACSFIFGDYQAKRLSNDYVFDEGKLRYNGAGEWWCEFGKGPELEIYYETWFGERLLGFNYTGKSLESLIRTLGAVRLPIPTHIV